MVDAHPAPGPFPQTSWSLIARCRDGASTEARRSLDSLFQRYWSPVFFFVLRYETRNVDDARDLTQGYFLSLLERQSLDGVDPDLGRFRSFVCASLRHYLANARRHAAAQKRRPPGGILSLDTLVVDPSFDLAGRDADPDAAFTEDWKRAIVAAVVARLTAEAERGGWSRYAAIFVEEYLDRETPARPAYDALCERHGLTYHQLKNGLHRARSRFVALLRAEVADQTSSPAESRAEAAELFGLR